MTNKVCSVFTNDNINPSNVRTECMKRVKTGGGAIRGYVNLVICTNMYMSFR